MSKSKKQRKISSLSKFWRYIKPILTQEQIDKVKEKHDWVD